MKFPKTTLRKLQLLQYLMILTLVSGLYSCKDNNVYTVKGVLLYNCQGEPIINRKIELVQDLGGSKPVFATTTTDMNGYFTFNYKMSGYYAQDLYIRSANGLGYTTYMENIPSGKNIENLSVYWSATADVLVKLNVINSYSPGDTLYHIDLRTRKVEKLVGPFVSGFFYQSPNTFPFTSEDKQFDSLKLGIGYKVNSTSTYIEKRFSVKQCGSTTVTLDIQ